MAFIVLLIIFTFVAFFGITWIAFDESDNELSEEAQEMKSDLDVELIWAKYLNHKRTKKIHDHTTPDFIKEVNDMTADQYIEALKKYFQDPMNWEKEGKKYHIEYADGKIKYFVDGKEV